MKRTPRPNTRPPTTAASRDDLFKQNRVTRGDRAKERQSVRAVRQPEKSLKKHIKNFSGIRMKHHKRFIQKKPTPPHPHLALFYFFVGNAESKSPTSSFFIWWLQVACITEYINQFALQSFMSQGYFLVYARWCHNI